MKKKNIEIRPFFLPINEQPILKENYKNEKFPNLREFIIKDFIFHVETGLK